MKKMFFLVLLGCMILSVYSQPQQFIVAAPQTAGFSPERLKKMDEVIQGWVNDPRLNGCVALIVHNGKIVYHKGFGYNDLDKKQPMKADAIFRICSQTKAITSAAVLMLYEEGKFLLDDPVSRYIPEFAHPVVLDQFNAADSSYTTIPAKSEITIRQLLTHTSGIGYAQIGSKEANAIYGKAGLNAGFSMVNGPILGNDIKKLAKLPLFHQPGEKFTYGMNADVLGYLVEVVSGMSLDAFFRKRIFEPLGMTDTYFAIPAAKQDRLVNLFFEKDRKLTLAPEQFDNNGLFMRDYPKMPVTYYSGGAGLSSTALDYAKFLQMILNGGTFNGKRLLSRNTVRMMTMDQLGSVDYGVNRFGLGFGITTTKGSALLPTPEGVFEWGGAYSTTYWADPKEQVIGIFYRQLWHSSFGEIANKFKVMLYSALQ